MRVPTYIDAETNRLSEVPEGDFLSTVGSGIAEGHVVLTGATPAADLSSAGSFELTLSGNATVSFTNPPSNGTCGFSFAVTQDAGASGFTVTWPAGVKWPDGTAPDLTADAAKTDVFVFTTSDGTNYTGMSAGKNI
jgi:hypothetical protein